VGARITGADENSIVGNEIAGASEVGMLLEGGAYENVLRGNVLRGNGLGISAEASEGNLFSLNALFDSLVAQATDDGTGNRWDDGARGNFWSDHPGGDPRAVPPNGVDRHPLAGPP
jgi:parallel beta-helix repeat protein